MSGGGFTHEDRAKYDASHDEWYTPPWLFDAMQVRFAVDPCSPGAAVVPWVPADRHLTRADDGLDVSKWGEGLAWVNPPYSETGAWTMRVIERHRASTGGGTGEALVLTFARTDTVWAQDVLRYATSVLFLRRRVRFIAGATGEPGGSPGAGSMIAAFGPVASVVLGRLAQLGHGQLLRA